MIAGSAPNRSRHNPSLKRTTLPLSGFSSSARNWRPRMGRMPSSGKKFADTEDGRVRPDAQRERKHGNGGEAGVLQELAKSEFEIIHNATLPQDSFEPLSLRG